MQPELKGLLAGLEGVAAIVARGEPLPPFDVHCPLTSLPLACKTELSSVPADIPYLHASEALIAKWRSRLDGVPAPRVALAWSGRATHVNDRNRSLSLSQLEPLLVGGRRALCQHPARAACRPTRELLAREPRIAHLGGELADFADTAAVLALADLVICVDTSVAHVAGALGRPAWVLLPFQPDWRWTLDRETSPWYPAHAVVPAVRARRLGQRHRAGARATGAVGLAARRHPIPHRFETLAECLRPLGEQPAGDAPRRRDVLRLPLADHRLQPRAPTRQRLMRLGVARQHREVLNLAEPVAQLLRLAHPASPEPRPQRLDDLHLIAMHHHALAQLVQLMRRWPPASRPG